VNQWLIERLSFSQNPVIRISHDSRKNLAVATHEQLVSISNLPQKLTPNLRSIRRVNT